MSLRLLILGLDFLAIPEFKNIVPKTLKFFQLRSRNFLLRTQRNKLIIHYILCHRKEKREKHNNFIEPFFHSQNFYNEIEKAVI